MDALPQVIAEKLHEVRALCEKHGVKSLAVFGSVAKETFEAATSDIDFVVEFLPHTHPLVRGERYWDLLASLQELFGRNVDLVVRSSVTNPYFAQVLEMTQRPLMKPPEIE